MSEVSSEQENNVHELVYENTLLFNVDYKTFGEQKELS